MNRINILNQKQSHNDDTISQLTDQKNALETEIKDIKTKKQGEIDKYKKNIEEMSHEFANMLKDTLETMKTKIEEADKKWEQENDGAMLKRFEEYANPKAS